MRPAIPTSARPSTRPNKGATGAPYATSNLTNLIIFKTLQGSVTQADWDRYLANLQHVVMGFENQLALRTLMNNFSHGVALDEDEVLRAIDIIGRRGQLDSFEFATIGYFILDKTRQPERAYPYFARSVQTAAQGDKPPWRNDCLPDEEGTYGMGRQTGSACPKSRQTERSLMTRRST